MLWETILLALREIRRNLMRSSLTVLGIVIGVAAVIIMVTLGSGATVQVSEQIASLGSNLLMITPGQRIGMGQRSAAAAFDVDDAEAIARDIGSISAVAPSSAQGVTAVFGNKNWSTKAIGIDGQYFKVRNWTIESGREFISSELRAGKAVCILGATVRKELFGRQDPLGSRIRVEKVSCQVIGILEAKGQSTMGTDRDDLILIPLRTFQRRIAGNQDIGLIQVSVQEGASTDKVKQDIEQLMRMRRHISPSEDDDFSVRDMKEIAKMLTGTTQVLTALLGAVAAVSLLVGGIGIMNIMLVSVTERTREIGIRLAIGALTREVLMQFLVEAVVLSSFGGLFGIVLALIASTGLARVLQIPFVFNLGIVVIAFFFSAAVGVIFGYFPARQAARMDPIEALRHE
ncbi:MAG: ABC transporter permease [Deltaproteobacteria bacterium]|nr:ABC transporter permease [Deltaproteobacteria bacterium]MBW1925956.1 ABC transporter permease [Deltaproteobacteria bacterium]MBW2097702.1 ABC transporter permease [Deltaproteobacteria bacterium]